MIAPCQHLIDRECSKGLKNRPSPGACAKTCASYTPVQITVSEPEPKPVPREQWPAFAKYLANLATDADVGIGDTVQRLLGTLGVAFKATLKSLGVSCGCNERRDRWNIIYKYDDNPPLQ